MQRRLLGIATALLISITATAIAQEKTAATAPPPERKPLSPAGYASTMVGGKWSAPDKDGERKYDGGKWIEVTYSRPMRRSRPTVRSSPSLTSSQNAPVSATLASVSCGLS